MNGWRGGPFQQALSSRSSYITTVRLYLTIRRRHNSEQWLVWRDPGKLSSSTLLRSGNLWIIQYQKYAFEYIPGEADGSIAWFVGDEETIRMTGRVGCITWKCFCTADRHNQGNAIGPNGNIGQRDISQEPMSMILNLGFSTAWAWIDYDVLA